MFSIRHINVLPPITYLFWQRLVEMLRNNWVISQRQAGGRGWGYWQPSPFDEAFIDPCLPLQFCAISPHCHLYCKLNLHNLKQGWPSVGNNLIEAGLTDCNQTTSCCCFSVMTSSSLDWNFALVESSVVVYPTMRCYWSLFHKVKGQCLVCSTRQA